MASECVCGLEADSRSRVLEEVTLDKLDVEVPMDRQKNDVLDVVIGWLRERSFLLVLGMSLFHIGLAYIHTRDSGRGD